MTPKPDEPEKEGGGSLIGGLLAPLRLPERVVVAIEDIAEAVRHVRPIRKEVETIRRQSSDFGELLPALTSLKEELGSRLDDLHASIVELEGIEGTLDERVGQLLQEIVAMHRTIDALKDGMERITDRLPDPDAPGPLERARDVFTGRND